MNVGKPIRLSALAICSTVILGAQEVPIYSVTVNERTVKAVNYLYRTGPTRIDFRGTVLLPDAKGEAVVESKAGRTEVDVKFDRVLAPNRFGGEYLTYVLWAITPEGHAKNLGEVLADGGDHARLHVSTDLQAFGMIVTAEPYSAVRLPSDVVVMENEIRPDTVGRTELIEAKYELLPRGHYTYVKPANDRPPDGPKVSMAEYEAMSELYQAQNAVQIAASQGADRFAADTFGKAQNLLREAQQMQAAKGDRKMIVTIARQAAQTAEDARTIAMKRGQESELATARAKVKDAEERRVAAERAAQAARIEASEERARLEQEKADLAAAAAAASASTASAAPAPQPAPVAIVRTPDRSGEADRMNQRDARMSLYRELSTTLTATDTPRGIVLTVPDEAFRGSALRDEIARKVGRAASVLALQRGLTVKVEGYSDGKASEMPYERAVAVRAALVQGGLPAGLVMAQGLGDSRAIASNASAEGRRQNRRVEIVVSGESIGRLPYWDKTYSLK